MNDEKLASDLLRTAREYARGAVIWNRSTGAKGIIVGYLCLGDSLLVRVNYGVNEINELPLVLTGIKPTSDDTEEARRS